MADSWGTPADPHTANDQPDHGAGAGDPPVEVADASINEADKQAQLERARGHGWTETVAFDYNSYQKSGGDNPYEWYGTAEKYEWKDDYGDVGPEIPELEKILFGNEFITREGAHRNNLDIEVTLEGPEKIAPIKTVSCRAHSPVF